MYQKSVTRTPRSTPPIRSSVVRSPAPRIEVRAERAPLRAALYGVAGALDAGDLGRPPGLEESPRDAVPHQIERSLRRALDVERDAERAGVRDVVAERDRPVELGLAHARERAPLLDRLAVEPGHEQERQDVGDAVGLEDDLVAAGLEIRRVARRPGFLGGPIADGAAVEVADPDRRAAARPVGGWGSCDPIDLGGRPTPAQPLPGAVREAEPDGRRRAEPGGLETAGGIDERADPASPLVRRRGRRRLVVVVDRRRFGTRRESGPVRVRADAREPPRGRCRSPARGSRRRPGRRPRSRRCDRRARRESRRGSDPTRRSGG